MTLAELYRAHEPALRRFVLYLTGDADATDDIVAETFVRALAAEAPLRAHSIEAYLLTIARNLARRRRTHARRYAPPPSIDLPDPTPLPDRVLAAQAEWRRTTEAMQQLPEPDRAALLMRAFGGLDYIAIGTALGIRPSNARVKVYRARQRLGQHRERS